MKTIALVLSLLVSATSFARENVPLYLTPNEMHAWTYIKIGDAEPVVVLIDTQSSGLRMYDQDEDSTESTKVSVGFYKFPNPITVQHIHRSFCVDSKLMVCRNKINAVGILGVSSMSSVFSVNYILEIPTKKGEEGRLIVDPYHQEYGSIKMIGVSNPKFKELKDQQTRILYQPNSDSMGIGTMKDRVHLKITLYGG